MFEYYVCTVPDNHIFVRQCKAFELNIPDLQKMELIIDVDSSETQTYFKDGKRIDVHNSNYTGAVFVNSEIELTQYFKASHPKPEFDKKQI